MSHLEEGNYRILEASSKNLVVHTADKNEENLVLHINEPDGNMLDKFGKEARFIHALFILSSDSIIIQWKVIPKSPGSNEYWIRNIKYNNTYAMARGRPSDNRPTEVKGVWLAPGQPLESDMLWRIEPAPTSGSYR